MDSNLVIKLCIFAALLIVDFVFYGFGEALRNVSESEIEKRYEANNDRSSKRILHMLHDPTKYVNTVQVIVHAILLYSGWLFATKWYYLFVLAFLFLLFGVLIPKRLAIRFPVKWAYFGIHISYYICVILTPITALVNLLATAILRIFGLKQLKETSDVTEEEIISMVNEGHEKGVLEKSEAEMITNIFEFGDKTAHDIMTNRQNMVMLEAQTTLSDAITFMLSQNNSRYPVYSENPDQIIGILHLKDACRLVNKSQAEEKLSLKALRQIMRKPEFVPETMKIDDLFHLMQGKKIQMAIVVDEYGQTAGLVAMEDILEEIVGNIQDEYDEEERHIIRTGMNTYIADGMTPLEEVEKILSVKFEDDVMVDTLNGFMILNLDHIPEKNENFSFEYQGYEFSIRNVEKKMITSVRIVRILRDDKEVETQSE